MNKEVLYQKIREILLNDWHPFSIGDNPNLVDEYDAFIPELYEVIHSQGDINQYLKEKEIYLAAPVSDEKREKLVSVLKVINTL